MEKLTGENARLAEGLREITGDDLPEVTSSSSKKASGSTGGTASKAASSSSPNNAPVSADDGAEAVAAASAPGADGVGGGASGGVSGDSPAHAGEFSFFFLLFVLRLFFQEWFGCVWSSVSVVVHHKNISTSNEPSKL